MCKSNILLYLLKMFPNIQSEYFLNVYMYFCFLFLKNPSDEEMSSSKTVFTCSYMSGKQRIWIMWRVRILYMLSSILFLSSLGPALHILSLVVLLRISLYSVRFLFVNLQKTQIKGYGRVSMRCTVCQIALKLSIRPLPKNSIFFEPKPSDTALSYQKGAKKTPSRKWLFLATKSQRGKKQIRFFS